MDATAVLDEAGEAGVYYWHLPGLPDQVGGGEQSRGKARARPRGGLVTKLPALPLSAQAPAPLIPAKSVTRKLPFVHR